MVSLGIFSAVRLAARVLRATADRLDPPARLAGYTCGGGHGGYPRRPDTGTYASARLDMNGFDWTADQ